MGDKEDINSNVVPAPGYTLASFNPSQCKATDSAQILTSIVSLREDLLDVMEPNFGLLDLLVSFGVLTHRQREDVDCVQAVYKKNAAILDCLKTGDQCMKFLTALTNTNQQHVVNFVLKCDNVEDVLPLTKTLQLRLDYIRPCLVRLVVQDDAFITDLYNYGCITWPQRNHLKEGRDSWYKNEKLIDFIRRRSIANYNSFADCLAKHHQSHVAQLLLCAGAVPCLVANLDEMSVDDVVTMETQIVSRSRDLRADEQKQISETLEKALHPLGHDVKLVVVEHRTSVGVYFICLSPEGLLQLRCLWRRGHLKNTIETVFTLLSGTTRPIIIKSFVWSSDNYQACVTYFGNTAAMEAGLSLRKNVRDNTWTVTTNTSQHGGYTQSQSLDKLPGDVLKIVMLRALNQLLVRDFAITRHFTTLASLSAACRYAVLDIRRRIRRGRDKETTSEFGDSFDDDLEDYENAEEFRSALVANAQSHTSWHVQRHDRLSAKSNVSSGYYSGVSAGLSLHRSSSDESRQSAASRTAQEQRIAIPFGWHVQRHDRLSATSNVSSGYYSGVSAGLSLPRSSSPGSKQSADNRTPKEQRRLHVIYQSEESSDSEHEYIDPDFHTGMSQPEEKRLVPTSTGHAMRLDRKPGHDYDNVIDTVRITAVKENLRPTIMSSKQQSVSKDEQPELLAKFSKIRKWSADEIKAAEDSQNAGSTSPQQYQNTAVSSSGMNAGRQLVSVKQHPAVPASEPSGDQSRGRRAVASSPAATKLPTSPDYVNVAPFVKPKSSRGGPVTIEPLSPGSSTPASRLVLNRQASEPAADVPPAVTQTSKKPVPLPAVGSERTGTSSRPLVPPKPLMPERDAAADGQEKKWHASSSVAFVNPMHRAKSATSLIPDSRGLVSVGDDVPPELPTGRRGHALARVVPPANVSDSLSNQRWYFGSIDLETSAQKLQRFLHTEGTFLVRRRKDEKDNLYSIDVVCNGQIKRVLIRQRSDKRFAIGSPKPNEKVFDTIPHLIFFYSHNGIELTDYPVPLKLTFSPPK